MSVTGGLFIQLIHSTGTYHAFLHAFLLHFLFIILRMKGMFTAIRLRRMVERMTAGVKIFVSPDGDVVWFKFVNYDFIRKKSL